MAGKFDAAKVKAAIAAGFSEWSKGTPPLQNLPKPKTQRVLDVTDRPNAPQSTIYVGMPVIDATNPDNIPLTVTNSLLGGSFGSRITTNIREQKGYTYSPTSQLSRRYHDTYWAEIADVTTASTGPALKEIFGEIERLQKEPPSAAELKGIQSYLSGVFVIQNSTRQALIGQLRYVDLQGLGEDYLKSFVQKVNAVTPERVQQMTGKYIKPETDDHRNRRRQIKDKQPAGPVRRTRQLNEVALYFFIVLNRPPCRCSFAFKHRVILHSWPSPESWRWIFARINPGPHRTAAFLFFRCCRNTPKFRYWPKLPAPPGHCA